MDDSVLRFLPMVRKIARGFAAKRRAMSNSFTSADYEDLVQDGLVGAMIAMGSHDGRTGLAPWVWKRAWAEMVDSMRRNRRGSGRHGFNKEALLKDAVVDMECPSRTPARTDAGVDVARLLSGLSERDRHMVRAHWLEDKGLREVGLELGVTESRVCQRLRQIFDQLLIDAGVSA